MRTFLLLAAFTSLVVVLVVGVERPSDAVTSFAGEAKVRLYSDGQVVGEWLASGPGRVEGDTFVFPARKGARDVQVRISGTFSFEEQPR